MSITLLSDETINKIAAGEVVERPLSVVKELAENSIDAGCTAVSIEIKDGGISFIRVTDNGCGIPASEIQTAFLRHATSKISTAEDLLTVASLGFRGEALASIAAVAKCELITRTSDSISAVRYVIEGGREVSREEIGAPVGTTFIIRDLFYNTPARRKFLKSAATEGAYISEAAGKLALAHPEVSVRLISGGQTRLHTPGSGRLRDVIFAQYGRDMLRDMLEANASDGTYALKGYIGKPALSRANRNYEIFQVNGRTIRSGLITAAVEEAYQGYVMQHRYPVALLSLRVPPELIDVNVHPAKLEVRFGDEEALASFITGALQAVISGKEIIVADRTPEAVTPVKDAAPARGPEPFELKRSHMSPPAAEFILPEAEEVREAAPEESYQAGDMQTEPVETVNRPAAAVMPVQQELELYEEKVPAETHKVLSPASRPDFKLIGSLFDTYLLIEYQGNFLMIDQHAAHEKVLYERFMKAYEERQITCQACNPPIIISLSDREMQVLNEHMEDFRAVGYEIEPFGGRDMAVCGVPGNALSIAREDLLIEMLDDLCDSRLTGGGRPVREKIAMMSCKAAVKGNMHLSTPEAEALIDELLQAENPYNCPHGRPTAVIMSKYEIEKKFKRIV